MENDNTTSIGIEFVDDEDNKENETDRDDKPVVVEEKPGIIKRVIGVVTYPVRWAYGKVKNSPASAAVGMIIGAGGALGGKALYDHFGKKHSGDFIPAEMPEVEIPDDGEEYATNVASDTTDD